MTRFVVLPAAALLAALPIRAATAQQYVVAINRSLDVAGSVPGRDMGHAWGGRGSFEYIGRSGRWSVGFGASQRAYRGMVVEPPADASDAELIVRPTLVMGGARFLVPVRRATLALGAEVGSGVARFRMDDGFRSDREELSGLAYAPSAAVRFPLNEQLGLELEGRYERVNLGDAYVQFPSSGYRVTGTSRASWAGISVGVRYRFAR